MNCPHCGAENQVGKVCGSCGKETFPLEEIEVRYKDFKVNEMLDIKIPPQSLHPQKDFRPPIPGNQKPKTVKLRLPEERPVPGRLSPMRILAFIIALIMILGFLAFIYFLYS